MRVRAGMFGREFRTYSTTYDAKWNVGTLELLSSLLLTDPDARRKAVEALGLDIDGTVA